MNGYYNPNIDMYEWSHTHCAVELANPDNFYTKRQIDKKLADIDGVTLEEVEGIVDEKTRPLSSKVDELLVQIGLKASVEYVDQKTGDLQTQIDNLLKSVLTREVVDEALGNYAKINDETLILNAENLS